MHFLFSEPEEWFCLRKISHIKEFNHKFNLERMRAGVSLARNEVWFVFDFPFKILPYGVEVTL